MEKSPNASLMEYINIYLDSLQSSKHDTINDELEIRFGTKYWNPITKITFNNVIAKIKSAGFTSFNPNGEYRLTIISQYEHGRSGTTRSSNTRVEINGMNSIQNYCRNDSINKEDRNINFVQKIPKHVEDKKGKIRLNAIDNNKFQFRINYKVEKQFSKTFGYIQNLIDNWSDNKKIFRFMKRFTFIHPDLPIKIDCSIVQSSNKDSRSHHMIPEYRIEKAGVFNNIPQYEIEIELDNSKLVHPYPTPILLEKLIKKNIRLILAGLQGTNFPCSYEELNNVLDKYMSVLYPKGKPDRKIKSSNFVGPSSISLELVNISPIDEDSKIANIRKPYTVTDKADGMRKLLFITNNGKMFLIDVNMKPQFTGVICNNREIHNTIIDGEHVLHNKQGQFINLYLAFDIYYRNKKDLRTLHFASKDIKVITRLRILNKTMNAMKLKSVVGEKLPISKKSSINYHWLT